MFVQLGPNENQTTQFLDNQSTLNACNDYCMKDQLMFVLCLKSNNCKDSLTLMLDTLPLC